MGSAKQWQEENKMNKFLYKILAGQLTYDKKTKSWTYTPLNKLTKAICQSPNKVQGHSNETNGYDYYIGRTTNKHTLPSNDLEETILWVEKNA